MIVYLNGEYMPAADAKISVSDRGFIFGDGVYEVTRACDGRLFEPDRHVARLTRGLRVLEIDFDDVDGLIDVHERLLGENQLTGGQATVYLQITRGCAPRAHAFPKSCTPTVFLSAAPFTPPHELRQRGAA